MPKVEYIGRKPSAVDRHAHSGKVWNGHGDVQEVTDEQAKLLCKFPDSFRLYVKPRKAKEPKDEGGEASKPEGEGSEAQP